MQTRNITFQSGLNNQLLNQCRNTNTSNIEKILLSNSIKASFDSNKPVAFSIQKILEIFKLIKQKTGSELFTLKTPQILTYLKPQLSFDFTGYGFCIPETQTVIKNKPPFLTGSIFYEKEESLESLNEKLDENYKNNKRSSSHYLAPFIHEIMHAFYIDKIYQQHGYEGNCPYTRQKYPHNNPDGLNIMQKLKRQVFSADENKVIETFLGKYAATSINQYHEVFAETFTKLICDCLSDKNSMPVTTPFEELKKYSPKFLKIFQKIISF